MDKLGQHSTSKTVYKRKIKGKPNDSIRTLKLIKKAVVIFKLKVNLFIEVFEENFWANNKNSNFNFRNLKD
jgi:hypothetical protein